MMWLDAILTIIQLAVLAVLLTKVRPLREGVGRLEASAKTSLEAAAVLKVEVEEVKRLDAEDRAELKRLLLLALQLSLAIGRGEAATKRIEDQAQGVADNFAAAQKRANEVDSDEAGAAADAAVKGDVEGS